MDGSGQIQILDSRGFGISSQIGILIHGILKDDRMLVHTDIIVFLPKLNSSYF